MTSEQRIESFDQVAHLYDRTRGESGRDDAVARGIYGCLEGSSTEPRVLEVGVGTGRIAVPLSVLGARVTGIDVSRNMLAVMRRKSMGVWAVQAEASRLPFCDGWFDAVVFVHILHLVPDPDATIRAALAAVRAGGVLIDGRTAHRFDVADPGHLLSEVKASLGIANWTAGERQRAASSRFRTILREAGASVERAEVAQWTERMNGTEFLDEVRGRIRSTMWGIPDEKLPAVLDGVGRGWVETFGGLDGVCETRDSFHVTVARLPRA